MRIGSALVTLAMAAAVAACGGAAAGAPSTDGGAAVALRLGYFPNITHATAIVGVNRGFFSAALGSSATLDTRTFNAGGDAVQAIFSGALDASYMGPNPAINGFIKSNGQAVRIVAGATSGGAALVVRSGITSAAELKGAKLATPSLGNTQDVALRFWLQGQGLTATEAGGGDVSILPQANGTALSAFVSGQIDGAWVPEPWATEMVQKGNGHVLVDERDLWPGGQFVTTELVVATSFLQAHRDVVKALIAGQITANAWINANPTDAQGVVGDGIAKLTGQTLPADVVASAWPNLTFTNDPIASSLQTSADHAKALGFLTTSDLAGIYDLSVLNDVLAEAGQPTMALP